MKPWTTAFSGTKSFRLDPHHPSGAYVVHDRSYRTNQLHSSHLDQTTMSLVVSTLTMTGSTSPPPSRGHPAPSLGAAVCVPKRRTRTTRILPALRGQVSIVQPDPAAQRRSAPGCVLRQPSACRLGKNNLWPLGAHQSSSRRTRMAQVGAALTLPSRQRAHHSSSKDRRSHWGKAKGSSHPPGAQHLVLATMMQVVVGLAAARTSATTQVGRSLGAGARRPLLGRQN